MHDITPKELASEAFVSMGRESSLSRMGEQICKNAGFVPNVSIRSDDPFYVRRCVELSLGVAIIPAVSWRGLFGDEVVIRHITEAKRETFVYVNGKKYMKSAVATFKDMLHKECDREAREAAEKATIKKK